MNKLLTVVVLANLAVGICLLFFSYEIDSKENQMTELQLSIIGAENKENYNLNRIVMDSVVPYINISQPSSYVNSLDLENIGTLLDENEGLKIEKQRLLDEIKEIDSEMSPLKFIRNAFVVSMMFFGMMLIRENGELRK